MAECCCGGDSLRLIYACSGAADTGDLSDRVARKITKDGCGKMTCLAAAGAGLSGFHQSALSADKTIVIDGCPVACGKKIFDNNSLPVSHHFVLTEMGVEKGKTAITDELIASVSETIKEALK